MKKLIFISLMVFVLASCSKDDENEPTPVVTQNNVLYGTKWTANDEIAKMIWGGTCTNTVEFSDNTNVKSVDKRNGTITKVEDGTYIIKGDSVKWTIGTLTMSAKINGNYLQSTLRNISSYGYQTYEKQ